MLELTEELSTLPYEAVVNFTYRCNLSCPFCFQHSEREKRHSELREEQWLDLIDDFSRMQIFKVTLSGGEPLAHPLWKKLLRRITEGKMRYELLTNGTLINESAVEFLVGLGRCQKIQLSLDGFETEHDAIRGKGTFQKTLKALKLLTDAGLTVVTNTVITRQNFRSIIDFARFLEALPIKHYRLTPYNECSGENVLSPDLLTPEEMADLITILDRHNDEMPRAFRKNLPYVLLEDIRSGGDVNAGFGICTNTYCAFGVHPDGAIVPCPDAAGPIMGYIGEQSFGEIWNNEKYRNFRRRALAGVKCQDDKCVDCPFAYRCQKFCVISHNDYYCRKNMATLLRQRGVVL